MMVVDIFLAAGLNKWPGKASTSEEGVRMKVVSMAMALYRGTLKASNVLECCAGPQYWQVSCPDKWRHSRSSLPSSACNWKPQAQGAIPVCTGRPGESRVGSCSCPACLALSTVGRLQVQLVPGKLFAIHVDVTKMDGNVLRISVSNIYSADSEKVGGGRAVPSHACSAAHNMGARGTPVSKSEWIDAKPPRLRCRW